ncbi:MAG: hypothetical protein PHE83_17435 [Opitutaceae bacterium]|nr:hypothetical protein [Opitutaceae bacterium]
MTNGMVPALAIGTSIDVELPSHPLVGTCIRVKKGEWRGASFLVRKPDGAEVWLPAAKFKEAVGRATPKNVNLSLPEARVGQLVFCTGKFMEPFIVDRVVAQPVGCGHIMAVTQKQVTAMDPYFLRPFVLESIEKPARDEVWRCWEAIATRDEARIAAAASELFHDEQDMVFGLGQCPHPAKTRKDPAGGTARNADGNDIDDLERRLCGEPSKRSPEFRP